MKARANQQDPNGWIRDSFWIDDNHMDPYVGDFNGDGTDDILWHDPSNATNAIWSIKARTPGDAGSWVKDGYPITAHWGIPLVRDFNRDGTDDVLMHYSAAKDLWLLRDRGISATPNVPSSNP